MNKLLVAMAGACLTATAAPAATQPPAQAAAPDPAELAEAQGIIAIMFPPAERMRMMDKIQQDIIAQMRPILPASFMSEPGLSAIMNAYVEQATARQRVVMQKRLPELLEAMAGAYTREFSLAELKSIHAFAGTPAGGHYLSRSTAILGDAAVAKVNTAMFKDMHATTQTLLPELKDKLIAYLKEHPDVAAKLESEPKEK